MTKTSRQKTSAALTSCRRPQFRSQRSKWLMPIGFANLLVFLLASQGAIAYPIDGYGETGIGRLEWTRRVQTDEIKGRKQPKGALLPSAAVDIRLTSHGSFELPEVDKKFSGQIRSLLGDKADRYAVSVLDLSDLNNIRYAEHNGEVARNPGSVGKLIVALGIFQALADLYPDDLAARKRVLTDTIITADEFIISDSHTVRMWDRENEKLIRRPLKIGDKGTLYEYLDWMVSPSSNAAAATLTKHGMLLKHYGTAYPVADDIGTAYFKDTPSKEKTATLADFIEAPISRHGMSLEKMRQGSFFTRTGKKKVQGTTSYATPREMMKMMLLMEQGKLVDEFSSREMKRLMYVTERRIRYASAPALRDSAVYFKSGSWYKCEPEPDFVCKKYHGNVRNLMNSVAIVESPAESRDLFYIVTLMSNVLRRNSAVDHQTFATRTHRLIKSYHAGRSTKKPAAAPQKNTSAASTMSTEETAPQKPKVETDQQGHTVHYY